MDEFDKIYNEILKEEKNNEAVYKSRLKTKYKAFLEGKNTDMLCKMIQAYSINKTIASPTIAVVEKKIEVKEESKSEEKEHIRKLTRENFKLKFKQDTTWEHKHNVLEKELENQIMDCDFKLKIIDNKNIEIKFLKKKLAQYGAEEYLDYL
jgi:monoamine oxidase